MKVRVKNMRIHFWALCVAVVVVCSACAATELEERCFPILVSVGLEDGKVAYALGFPKEGIAGEENKTTKANVMTVKQKDFKESKMKYESRMNKLVDYNHLKVIVLEEDFIKQIQLYEEMIDYLAQTEEFPRNTYVCAVDDVEELMEIETDLSQELGTYLEEYLNKNENAKGDILTLGDLMDEKENKKMVLYIPYLEVEDSYVEWDGYYAVGMGLPPVRIQ